MASKRGALLLLPVLVALTAAGGAGWLLLSGDPAAETPVEPPRVVPTFTGPSGDGPDPAVAEEAGRGSPRDPEDPDDDMADLDRTPSGPEGGADTQDILDAAARGDWLEVERLLSTGGSSDPAVTQALLDGLQDDRWRNRVAELAQYLKDPGALGRFLEIAAGDGSQSVRAAALLASSWIGGPGVLEAAGRYLREEKPGSFLSGAAALALGRIGTPESARQLVDMLRERTGGPYAAAMVQALGGIRNPEALAAVGEMAMDAGGDPEFRANLVKVLGESGDPSVMNDLLRVSRGQEDESIRSAAYRAMARVGTPEAVAELLSVLAGPDNPGRYQAAQALEGLKSKAAAPALEKALEGPMDPILAPYAVTALGKIGSKSSVDVLSKIAGDFSREPGIRGTAVRSLGEIGDSRAAPLLLKILQDTPPSESGLRNQVFLGLQAVATPEQLPALKSMLEKTKTESTDFFYLKSLVGRLEREAEPGKGVKGW